MTRAAIFRIDCLNIALIGGACILAHVFPYHLLVLSYVVLGPAHYLTQISWLHERSYFTGSRWIGLAFVGLTVLLMRTTELADLTTLLVFALVLALTAVVPLSMPWRAGILGVGAGLAWLAGSRPELFVLTILLPTAIHVFVFTAIFMYGGARRSGQASSYVAFAVHILGAASFLLPVAAVSSPDLVALSLFKPVVGYVQSVLQLSSAHEVQFFGFLSYAYTYHYLNWFSKVELLRWHEVPRPRLAAIVVGYAGALGVYAYDTGTGVTLLLFLSLLHVLLEFPLNWRSITALAAPIQGRPGQAGSTAGARP
jgi:hypothetical protein